MVTQRVTCDLAGRLVLLDEEPVVAEDIMRKVDKGDIVPGAFYSWGEALKKIIERPLKRVIPITDKGTADRYIAHINGYFMDNGLDYLFIDDYLNSRIVSDREIVAKNKKQFGIAMRTGYVITINGDVINCLRQRATRVLNMAFAKARKILAPGTSEQAYGVEAKKAQLLDNMLDAHQKLIEVEIVPSDPPPPRKKF